jgi:hypothetical protein
MYIVLRRELNLKILLEGPPNKQLNITLNNYIFCTYAGEADSLKQNVQLPQHESAKCN